MPTDQATRTRYEIRLLDREAADQDEESCEVVIDGEPRTIRFHDYDEIFTLPGLYEQLFYDELRCRSPRTLREMLVGVLEEDERDPAELSVLDIGAGNGMVAEELASIGAGRLVGVDIIEEAAAAAERDRPGVYDGYVVVDLTDIPPEADLQLAAAEANCLTTAAALGFGDIPPEAFAGAYRYVAEAGLVAFSIKSEFVGDGDRSGFARLMEQALEEGALRLRARRRFPHRLSAAGEPIEYDAFVAEKAGELPGFPID